jgi:hypothetical protein
VPRPIRVFFLPMNFSARVENMYVHFKHILKERTCISRLNNENDISLIAGLVMALIGSLLSILVLCCFISLHSHASILLNRTLMVMLVYTDIKCTKQN